MLTSASFVTRQSRAGMRKRSRTSIVRSSAQLPPRTCGSAQELIHGANTMFPSQACAIRTGLCLEQTPNRSDKPSSMRKQLPQCLGPLPRDLPVLAEDLHEVPRRRAAAVLLLEAHEVTPGAGVPGLRGGLVQAHALHVLQQVPWGCEDGVEGRRPA